MPITKSHGQPSKRGRKSKEYFSPQMLKNVESMPKKYGRTEKIIDEVYADIANGNSRSEIQNKLMSGLYTSQDGVEMKRRNAQDYYNAALDRFAVDTDIEAEKLRKMFYGRYEALLAEAIKKGDIYNARGILDSMSRVFGIERKEPKTAIQINGSEDGKVVVNFGFNNNENVSDSE